MPPEPSRPDPDKLLAQVQVEEQAQKRGHLKIILGYAAGVGKTYAMLEAAHQRKTEGVDVVVGYVETHQQVKAITAMKLTRQDLFTTMSSLGLTTFGANGTPEPNSPPGTRRGFPGGEPGGMGGTRPTPNATFQAARAQFANRIPTPLMNALIDLLQKRAQS